MIQIKDLNKTYGEGTNAVHALRNCNVEFEYGKFTAIIGTSGSGKSTLLHLMGGLDTKAEGEIFYDDEDILRYSDAQLAKFRRKNIGFVFQFFNLVPELTAKENIFLPMMIDKVKVDEEYFDKLTEKLGISERLTHYPSQLSGGQQQRLCIARAMAVSPSVLLMDEPASALDPISTAKVEELIHELKKDYTIVIVTHSMQQAARASDYTGFFYLGNLIEYDKTSNIFQNAKLQSTNDYVSGHFG